VLAEVPVSAEVVVAASDVTGLDALSVEVSGMATVVPASDESPPPLQADRVNPSMKILNNLFMALI
jgi:hypothetical protein